jgi:hypothetical protein
MFLVKDFKLKNMHVHTVSKVFYLSNMQLLTFTISAQYQCIRTWYFMDLWIKLQRRMISNNR